MENILYRLAAKEGEGLGTAYEYLAKQGILRQALNKKKEILVYGLPEKYGFGMDIAYSADRGCNIDVFDARQKKAKAYAVLAKLLKVEGIIKNNPQIIKKIRKNYSIVISSEVLQQLCPKEFKIYLNSVMKASKEALFFVPNADNRMHSGLSGLKGLSLEELKRRLAKKSGVIIKSGYIDMPPFPPGIKAGGNIRKSRIAGNALYLLLPWLMLERIMPCFVKKRFSHICYAWVRWR